MISTDTKLKAVNKVLSSIGDSPVNTIEKPTNVNVINAISILEDINREEQSKGRSFNSIPSYTLNVDINTHMINWSSTYLRLKASNGNILSKKGDYVYNFSKQTFLFTGDIKVSAIILVDMDEMPEPMKNYIIAKASYEFQNRYLGDHELAKRLEENLREAWASLQDYEMETNDYNMLKNPEVIMIVGA